MVTKKHTNRGKNGVEIPTEAKRLRCVSVRLNADELDLLDMKRQKMQRGSFFRAMLIEKMPVFIPQINKEMHLNLGRSLGNLATVSTAMRAGNFVELDEIKKAVHALRLSLILPANSAETDDKKED